MTVEYAPLSVTRENFNGTPPDGFPDGISLLNWMDDTALETYLLGQVKKSQLGLPGSGFTSDEPEIAQRLLEYRELTKQSLIRDIDFIQRNGRNVPQDVIDFIQANPCNLPQAVIDFVHPGPYNRRTMSD
jgi:hypothetical protein